MSEAYTRQSSFSNGDVIDAPLFNAEFDQLQTAFGETAGHNHDGTVGAGAPVPLISDGAAQVTGVFTDVTDGLNKKLRFKINGVEVLTLTQASGTVILDTANITHTPDGGSEQPLNTYLDTLEVAVGDAATDAAAAAVSAQKAENAAMVVGIPVIIADAGTYVIPNDAEVADVIFEGDGTLTLPTVLVKGRRFTARLSYKAIATKQLQIPNPNFSILGDKLTLSAGDGLTMKPGELIVLEAISTTELEII